MTGHDAMNAAIRAQAGRMAAPEPTEKPVGDVGVGRGGACRPREWPAQASMSSLIRAARDLRREELYSRARSYEQAALDG